MIDATHSATLSCWVPGADGHPDFPIQNLPLCSFSAPGRSRRGGVAIGDFVLDLKSVLESGLIESAPHALEAASGPVLNPFFALPARDRRALRDALSAFLATGNTTAAAKAHDLLISQDVVTYHLPADIGDYSDFFAGIHHAKTAGKMFRPDNPLLPNYKHVPIAYHGRSSSIRVSGHPAVHPIGQRAPHGATTPEFGESQRVDFELELALWVQGGNALGSTIPIAEAGDHIVGVGLLNDWSARDIQAWETQPLGPFLAKNFLTSVSPFVVTAEALAPYRKGQAKRPEGDPAPLPYLLDAADQAGGAFDIRLEVFLCTQRMRDQALEPVRITRASGLDLYWTPAQMVAHHTSNGCSLRPGDLFGSGTVSADAADGHGSLLELTSAGKNPVALPSGETRAFLQDGDEIVFRGWCEAEGFVRIGLGEVRGVIVANPASGGWKS